MRLSDAVLFITCTHIMRAGLRLYHSIRGSVMCGEIRAQMLPVSPPESTISQSDVSDVVTRHGRNCRRNPGRTVSKVPRINSIPWLRNRHGVDVFLMRYLLLELPCQNSGPHVGV
ncbi:hypothetical protein MTO96_046050 [Rhipicephalus appendiculatus]